MKTKVRYAVMAAICFAITLWCIHMAKTPQKHLRAEDIEGVTLLSVEEYEAASEYVPCVDGGPTYWWWLRSPGCHRHYAAYVCGENGQLDAKGYPVNQQFGVRPALILKPGTSGLQNGDKVRAAGCTWTAIPGNMVLCDKYVGKAEFRKDWQAEDANSYEDSDIKLYWLEIWANKNGLPNM